MPKQISPYVYPGISRFTERHETHKLETITVNDIVNIVTEKTGVPLSQIATPCRLQHIVDARQLIYYLALMYVPNCYTTSISKAIGLPQDHSTVIHGKNCIVRRMSAYSAYHQWVSNIQAQLHTLHATRYIANVVKPVAPTLQFINQNQ